MLNKQNVSKSAPQDINKAAENYQHHLFEIRPDSDSTWSFRSADGKWNPALRQGSLTLAQDGAVYVSAQDADWSSVPPEYPWKKIVPAKPQH